MRWRFNSRPERPSPSEMVNSCWHHGCHRASPLESCYRGRRWHQLWCHKFKVVRKASANPKLISFGCSLIIGSRWANSADPWHIVTLHCVIAILFNSLARHGQALWLNCLRRQLVQRYTFAANWLVELGWKLAIGSNFNVPRPASLTC